MLHFVYLMASRPRGALYLGSTNDLRQRVEQHRAKAVRSHTATYNIGTLVWFEQHPTYRDAIHRERRIKKWRRAWKIALIEESNPDWRDVSSEIPL
ncbi:GIY-YIG nuclease family protein [Roseobacter sp. HKCCA0434]|uniref:GIY-YIG nuclease family protein n=1 Tax=Roseobacter sp. HKCCA0434 TaxID=3079297 RepID=UPI002905AC85|nr:GIY-YIG nuclease family protein [Roseobacter sp. HKCCA0434]